MGFIAQVIIYIVKALIILTISFFGIKFGKYLRDKKDAKNTQ